MKFKHSLQVYGRTKEWNAATFYIFIKDCQTTGRICRTDRTSVYCGPGGGCDIKWVITFKVRRQKMSSHNR